MRRAGCLLLAIAGCLSSANAQQPAQQPLPYARSVVDTLASPAFAGRGYLDDVDGRAAKFLAESFEEMGLLPVGESYQQEFPITVDVHPQTPVLKLNENSLQAGISFLPFPGSAPGSATHHKKLVHAGSGLYIPDLQINAFQGLDLKDAIVVIEEAVPDSLQGHDQVSPGLLQTSTRIEIAGRLGARGVIVLTDGPLSQFYSPVNVSIPAYIVNTEAWPGDVEAISFSQHPLIDWETSTSNVIARIPGTKTPDEYLLVMAHYDHLGRLGDEHYFPGANDNASGVALTLALANYFSSSPLERTLVFIGFSGEEQGLQGSRHFVTNPPFPLEKIRFLVNLDMVASGSAGIMAVGGSDFAEEFTWLSTLNDSLQLGPLGKRPNAPNSDHYFFLQQGVRGFFLYTNKGTQPYHNPQDVPATLDWEAFEKVYALVKAFLKFKM